MSGEPAEAIEARWRALVEKSLGAPLDSLSVRPLDDRRRDDGPRPWRAKAAWQIAQRVDHPDPEQAGRLAIVDLEGGADALTVVAAGSPYARGFGLAAETATLDLALARVELDLISTRLDAGADTLAAARALAEVVDRRRLTSARIDLALGYDPAGLRARTGRREDGSVLGELIDIADRAGLMGGVFLADGRPFHEAGASAAQELGCGLAVATSYLRRLEGLGLGLDAARAATAMLVVVDADVATGLAKMRAARRLWARVEAACGLTPRPLRLHAETAWRMMGRYDPWVNAMRMTAAVFAAGLGGADTVTALPFTLATGLPDEPARRLARNTQRVLIDESHLDAVDDPAAGSGAFEALTDGLCAEAWALFQAIERAGGIERALEDGSLRQQIAGTARARADALARLHAGLVGTTRFPSLDSPVIGVLDAAPLRPIKADGDALPASREAEPFEALRDRIEALDPRPAVALATLGPPAAYGARATYAANIFAIAGLAAEIPTEAADAPTLVRRFASIATPVVCLCGSDADYAADGEALARALREAGAERVLIVAPEPPAAGLRAAGVNDALHDGCEILRILEDVVATVMRGRSSPHRGRGAATP